MNSRTQNRNEFSRAVKSMAYIDKWYIVDRLMEYISSRKTFKDILLAVLE